jgi:serine/threonine protein phosphatase PrpC
MAAVSARSQPTPIEAAVLSDRGQVREINEDAVLIEPAASLEARTRGVLCVLADGMGGYAAGEVASQLAVQRVRQDYYTSATPYIADALRGAIEAANQEVWQQGQDQAEHSGMGSTLTAAVLMHEHLVVGHVGDSRAYLVRGRGVTQITQDHSWVAEQVACGALSPEQANNHPQRNVILRALGASESVQVAVYRETLLPGDAVVLCSDGLSTVVSDQEIGHTVSDFAPEEAARRLVTLANTRGAPDNVTLAILHLPAPATPWPTRLRHWGPLMAALAVLLALGVAIGFASNRPVSNESEQTDVPTQAVEVTPPAEAALTSARPSVQGLKATVAEGAHFREGPNTNAPILDIFDHDERVLVLDLVSGDVPTDHTTPAWYKVTLPHTSKNAFVYGDFLNFGAADAAGPALQTTDQSLPLRGGSAR